MLKAQRILLMIGDDGIVVAPDFSLNAAPFFAPHGSKKATQEIVNFIAKHPQARVTLMADNLAQDYRSDSLPKLNPLDRARLAQRRLKQHFPQAALSAWLRARHAPGQILLAALHDSNPAFGWVERLRNRLPDICLLPIEGARMIPILMPEASSGWAMLVSRQKSGGFRQIVTHKGNLIFTRLTPLPGDQDEADIVARDIKASLDYLTRHGLRDPKDLSVLLLISDNRHLDPVFSPLGLGAVRSLSPLMAAKQLRLDAAPTEQDDSADLLFAYFLMKRGRPLLSLRLPDMREAWLTRKIQYWGLRAACVCLAFAFGGSVWQFADLGSTIYKTQKTALLLQQNKHALADAQANAAPLTQPLGRMRQALERKRIFEQKVNVPWENLATLSTNIGSDARIARLEWRKDNDTAPDRFTLTLRVDAGQGTDRAEKTDAFARTAQAVAAALPAYATSVTKSPFASEPQEVVTAANAADSDPLGEITLLRKTP